MANVAINGFGRIGRLTFRAALANPNVDLNVVAINDLTSPDQLAHLFKYDSVMGIYPGDVSADGDTLVVDGRRIKILAERDPANLPWKELGVDVVIESTGFFTNAEKAKKHIEAGAKKVLISAPAKGEDITLAIGINAEQVSTHTNSVEYSLFEPLSDGFRKVVTEGIEDTYQRFLSRVAEGRDLTIASVDSLAQGRVWSGTDAKRMGLVDELGGLDKGTQYRRKPVNVGFIKRRIDFVQNAEW